MVGAAVWLGVADTEDVEPGGCAWGALTGRSPGRSGPNLRRAAPTYRARADVVVAPPTGLPTLRDEALRFLQAQGALVTIGATSVWRRPR